MTDTSTQTVTKTRLKEPSQFNVIYLNDDKTSMEFVVDSLVIHFDYSDASATAKMLEIHQEGSAVVAVLPYEIAEQKGVEVITEARAMGFPFQVKIEPE